MIVCTLSTQLLLGCLFHVTSNLPQIQYDDHENSGNSGVFENNTKLPDAFYNQWPPISSELNIKYQLDTEIISFHLTFPHSRHFLKETYSSLLQPKSQALLLLLISAQLLIKKKYCISLQFYDHPKKILKTLDLQITSN